MKKYFLLGLFFLSAALILGGCAKKELSSEEAVRLLSKNPPGKLLRSVHRNPPIKTIGLMEREAIEKMQTAGYLSVKEVSGPSAHYEVAATSKLSPFLDSENADLITFKVGSIVVDKIESISMKGDEADVSYTTKLAPTKLAEDLFPSISNPSAGPNHAVFRWADGNWK